MRETVGDRGRHTTARMVLLQALSSEHLRKLAPVDVLRCVFRGLQIGQTYRDHSDGVTRSWAKRKMKTEEGLLKDKVKRYLGALPRVYWHMPVPSGYGAQTLDFLCCIDGRFCGIETKAKGKEPTPRQNKCIADIKAAGGAAFWCDSFESFLLNIAAWGLAPNV